MDFHPRQKLNYNFHPPISLAGQNIDQVFCAKYFRGLMVDNNLSWHDDTEHISGKISKIISVLVKVKRCLNSSSLVNIIYIMLWCILIFLMKAY